MAYDILVIGAGQAGLAMGYHLRDTGRDFLLLDAAEALGSAWRRRWDSLRLFTSARRSGLPGLPFPGAAGRYPGKDEVSDYLAGYAERFDLPIRLGTRVHTLRRTSAGFEAATDRQTYLARQVVIATGPFQEPAIPASRLDVPALHTADYRNPEQLPDGPVIVVGAGNSGAQIAAELAATRQVTLSVGRRQPVMPQRLLGRDIFDWLGALGLVELPTENRLARRMRQRDPLIGVGPKRLRRDGVDIVDRVVAADGDLLSTIDGTRLKAAAVIWATGYRPAYSWIDIPGAVGGDGWPRHHQGRSPVPGLYFLGLPYLRNRGSALLGWVGGDAAHLRDRLVTADRPGDRRGS